MRLAVLCTMNGSWKGTQAEGPERSQLIIKSLMQIIQDGSGVGVWRWGTESRAKEKNSARN